MLMSIDVRPESRLSARSATRVAHDLAALGAGRAGRYARVDDDTQAVRRQRLHLPDAASGLCRSPASRDSRWPVATHRPGSRRAVGWAPVLASWCSPDRSARGRCVRCSAGASTRTYALAAESAPMIHRDARRHRWTSARELVNGEPAMRHSSAVPGNVLDERSGRPTRPRSSVFTQVSGGALSDQAAPGVWIWLAAGQFDVTSMAAPSEPARLNDGRAPNTLLARTCRCRVGTRTRCDRLSRTLTCAVGLPPLTSDSAVLTVPTSVSIAPPSGGGDHA